MYLIVINEMLLIGEVWTYRIEWQIGGPMRANLRPTFLYPTCCISPDEEAGSLQTGTTYSANVYSHRLA